MRKALFLTCICSFLVVGSAAGPGDEETKVVNLARLSIARVSASSVNGNRSMRCPYYGVRNMFDGGTNVINNINYTYWLSDRGSRHLVKVRFLCPVVVREVLIETIQASPYTSLPREVALHFETSCGGKMVTVDYDSIPLKGFRTRYALPAAVENVSAMTLIFFPPGYDLISISEIEILGFPPPGTNETPTRPALEVDDAEAEKVARETVQEYVRKKYAKGQVSRTREGWTYEIIAGDKPILRVLVDEQGEPIRIEDLEADIAENLRKK